MNLSRIDINKITADGRYVDFATNTILTLSDDIIFSLREYYLDNTIAYKRKIEVAWEFEDVQAHEKRRREDLKNSAKSETVVSREVHICDEEEIKARRVRNDENATMKRYKFTRSQKYNDGKHVIKGGIDYRIFTAIKVGAITVLVAGLLAVGSYFIDTRSNDVSLDDTLVAIESTEVENKPVAGDLPTQDFEELRDDLESKKVTKDTSSYQKVVSVEEVETKEVLARKEIVKNLCAVYGVDFDKIYKKLKEQTDNFTSVSYLEGKIDGVTCKGAPVVAKSEEELLVYFVRACKQLPEKMGLSNISVPAKNDRTDYCNIIKHYADLFAIDSCLVYAIIQSECGFDSEMFNTINNPAGLRINGKWWDFDSKEEGIIELMLEILKYNRMGAHTIEEIGAIHAPVSDGNALWIPNVTENYIYAKMNYEELFGGPSEEVGLKP